MWWSWIRGRQRPTDAGSELGFTLLESLIALVILGMAIGMCLQAFGLGLRAQGRARGHLEAVALAEGRMSALALLPPDSLERYATPRSGRFPPPFEGYEWRALTRSSPTAPRLMDAAVLVDWRGGSFALETTLYLPERVAPVMGGIR